MLKKLMIKIWVKIHLFILRRKLKKAYSIYLKNEERLKYIQEILIYEVEHTEP